MSGGVLPGVGDIHLAVQNLDVERGVVGGEPRVGEGAGRQPGDPVELRVVDLDGSGPEVGGVEQGGAVGIRGMIGVLLVAMASPL